MTTTIEGIPKRILNALYRPKFISPSQVHTTHLILSAISQQLYKVLYLVVMYVLLEKYAVVVDQSSYRVLSQHTVPNLTLHSPQKLVGYLLLSYNVSVM